MEDEVELETSTCQAFQDQLGPDEPQYDVSSRVE